MDTAVVVAFPACEPVVGPLRRRYDASATWGVPAHVTVLYPFVAYADLTEGVVASLALAVGSVDEFDCALVRPAWFGDEVLYLEPDPAAPLRALTNAVWEAFPEHPPYDGAYDDVVPHLTVGDGSTGSSIGLQEAAGALVAYLPIRQRVDRVLLMAGGHERDSWRVLHELPLRHAPAEGSS